MIEQLLDRPCPDCDSIGNLAISEETGMYCSHCAHILSNEERYAAIHAGAHSLSKLWSLWTCDGHYLTMGWLDYCLWVKATEGGDPSAVLTPTERTRLIEYSQRRLNPEHTVMDEIRLRVEAAK